VAEFVASGIVVVGRLAFRKFALSSVDSPLIAQISAALKEFIPAFFSTP
jgi:hypothetical protein